MEGWRSSAPCEVDGDSISGVPEGRKLAHVPQALFSTRLVIESAGGSMELGCGRSQLLKGAEAGISDKIAQVGRAGSSFALSHFLTNYFKILEPVNTEGGAVSECRARR
jgi:hypothetical protein